MTVIDALPDGRKVAHRRELLAAGFSAHRLASEVRRGAVIRPRRGWYVDPGAAPAVIQAVRIGGRLAGISAARHYGLAVPRQAALEVQVPANGARLRSPLPPLRPRHARDGVMVHWSGSSEDLRDSVAVPIEDCLRQIAAQQAVEFAVAVLDSALHRGLMEAADLSRMIAGWPRRLRSIATLVDGEAESFLESVFRCRIRLAGIECRIQVPLLGRYRVDAVIGDRLLVELDGAEHHHRIDDIERDRDRELELQTLGFVVVRLSYRQVMDDWPRVLGMLEEMIRRGVQNSSLLAHPRHHDDLSAEPGTARLPAGEAAARRARRWRASAPPPTVGRDPDSVR